MLLATDCHHNSFPYTVRVRVGMAIHRACIQQHVLQYLDTTRTNRSKE